MDRARHISNDEQGDGNIPKHTPHDITLVFLSQRYFVNGVCFSPLAVLTTSRSVFHGSTSFSHERQ